MKKTISNHILTATFDTLGAELISLKKENTEYIWNADPLFWGRHSPVLFPVVGRFKNKQYTHDHTTYPMDHHGFARDKEFSLLSETKDTLWFRLTEDTETLNIYPFYFYLDIGYQLMDNVIKIMWKVTNKTDAAMYFFIGAHPALNCPLNADGQWDFYLDFHTDAPVYYQKINPDNLVVNTSYLLDAHQGIAPMALSLFDDDVCIIKDTSISKVTILTENKQPWLSITFTAPVLGLWSPVKKNAPFICIEPWYGCNDSADFSGELKDRPYVCQLAPNDSCNFEYSICIY